LGEIQPYRELAAVVLPPAQTYLLENQITATA
jgi:hypothetical protein